MSTPSLSTTSYAVLGLLAVKPWSSYELTQQMDRSLGRIWPRAVSKLYEEPKKLVAHGLARASTEMNGQRSRTVYAITAQGRRALRRWLAEPGDGPSLEFEQMVKVFFAEHATTADLRRTLTTVDSWARERCAESLAVGEQYLHGRGPFPERLPELMLTSRFLTDFYLLLRQWAQWASDLVESWPEDPQQAAHDPEELIQTVRRAAAGAAATHASARAPFSSAGGATSAVPSGLSAPHADLPEAEEGGTPHGSAAAAPTA